MKYTIKKMKNIAIALVMVLFFTVLTGIIYPLFITGIAQVAFPKKANGSLVIDNGKLAGSVLIGQQFDSIIYFSSRPSAISYNPIPSGGTNYSLTSQIQKKLVEERRKQFISFNQLDDDSFIPSEMLFASASGIDPHISPEAALLQVDRIAKARNFSDPQKEKLIQRIQSLTENPQFLLLGEKRINVFLLNLELDKIK